MWLWFMYFIMLPAQALSYAEGTPLLLPQQLESSAAAVKVLLGDSFEHVLGQLDVSVFVFFVRVSISSSEPIGRQRWATCRPL